MNQLNTYQQFKVRVQLVRDRPATTLPIIQLNSPQDVYLIFKDELMKSDRERFLSVMLNSRNQIIAIDEVSIGSLTAMIVHPRELFKSAILANANSLVLVHNHPSDDPAPSPEDIAMTEKLIQAAQILNIDICDHIIITQHDYSSWSEEWASHTVIPDDLPF